MGLATCNCMLCLRLFEVTRYQHTVSVTDGRFLSCSCPCSLSFLSRPWVQGPVTTPFNDLRTNSLLFSPSLPTAVCSACIAPQPSLQSDWLSFTSRPWVQGPVDAFLGNTHLAAMMSQHKELAVTVEGLVQTLDTALMKVGGAKHCSCMWCVGQHCVGHLDMYVIMQAPYCHVLTPSCFSVLP